MIQEMIETLNRLFTIKKANISCDNKKMCQVSCVQDPTMSAWPRFRPHVHLYTMKTWVQTVIDIQKYYAR